MNELEQLKARVKQLEQQEKEKLKKIQDQLKPVYRFTIRPTEDHWTTIHHQDYCLVNLQGECLNIEEYTKNSLSPPMQGGMNYLYDAIRGSIICKTGGGCIWFQKTETAIKLGKFLLANPEGGDVTDIINEERNNK